MSSPRSLYSVRIRIQIGRLTGKQKVSGLALKQLCKLFGLN